MTPQNFTNKSQEAIQAASRLAHENGQPQIEPLHLFLAFLHDREGTVSSIIKKLNGNTAHLETAVQNHINQLPKQGQIMDEGNVGQIMLSQHTLHLFQTAAMEAKKMGDEYISI